MSVTRRDFGSTKAFACLQILLSCMLLVSIVPRAVDWSNGWPRRVADNSPVPWMTYLGAILLCAFAIIVGVGVLRNVRWAWVAEVVASGVFLVVYAAFLYRYPPALDGSNVDTLLNFVWKVSWLFVPLSMFHEFRKVWPARANLSPKSNGADLDGWSETQVGKS